MNKTKIDWCSASLNPVVGCTFNCPFCYARKLNTRFGWIEDFSKPQFFPDRLKSLYSKKPQTIFMDSMSDIADWKSEWIEKTFRAMKGNPQHTYLFLTKRYFQFIYKNRGVDFEKMLRNIENLMIGVSTTTQSAVNNLGVMVPDFLSVEPILEPIDLSKMFEQTLKLKWLIVGAETGNRKEKIIPQREWIEKIVADCAFRKVPVFLKSSLADIWGEPLIQEFPW
jgi:protein gp37